MPPMVTVDVAGGPMGGAARFRAELAGYLARTRRSDVQVIGTGRQVDPAWLVRRELVGRARGRRVALNNVSFISPGAERWTLLRNPLDFLSELELSQVSRQARASTVMRASVIHGAARRADVIVVPTNGMAERVVRVLPGVQDRVVVRPHPVSVDAIPNAVRRPAILCPVLFSPYKGMAERLIDLLRVMDAILEPEVSLWVTATESEVPAQLRASPRTELVGRLDHRDLRQLWMSSQAIYFPTDVESFGYPLAEARVSGLAVIALDTAQNREVAGPALCGFVADRPGSLEDAVQAAMTKEIRPDPAPFEPDSYFDWLLGTET